MSKSCAEVIFITFIHKDDIVSLGENEIKPMVDHKKRKEKKG